MLPIIAEIAQQLPRLTEDQVMTNHYPVEQRERAVKMLLLAALNSEIDALAAEVETLFGRHPDAPVYLSQPGLGPILGAGMLGEFGGDPTITAARAHARTT